jgi:hypothetical protein
MDQEEFELQVYRYEDVDARYRVSILQPFPSKCQPHLQVVCPVLTDKDLATESWWYNHNHNTKGNANA